MPMNESTKSENELKKKFLRSYRECEHQVERVNCEIIRLRMMKMYPSANQSDGMPHGKGGTNDLSGYIVELDRIERERDAQIEKCLKVQEQVMIQLDLMDDQEEAKLLNYKYIEQLTWEEIAEKFGYEIRQVYRKHGKALLNFKLPKDVSKCHSMSQG